MTVDIGSALCSYQDQHICCSLGLLLILPPDGHPDACCLSEVAVMFHFYRRTREQARKLLSLKFCVFFLGKRCSARRFPPTSSCPKTCTWPSRGRREAEKSSVPFFSLCRKGGKAQGYWDGAESTCSIWQRPWSLKCGTSPPQLSYQFTCFRHTEQGSGQAILMCVTVLLPFWPHQRTVPFHCMRTGAAR